MHAQSGSFGGVRSQMGAPRSVSAAAENDWCPDVDRIASKLWIGSWPTPGEEWATRGGIDLIVLCAQEYQPRSSNFPGVQVIHAGFDDAAFPSLGDYDIARCAAEVVSEELSKGQRVLVTCMQGRNRSGLVCALTLHLKGVSGSAALTVVRKMRRNALTNPKFASYLRALR